MAFGFSREWLRRNTKKSQTYFVRPDTDFLFACAIIYSKTVFGI